MSSHTQSEIEKLTESIHSLESRLMILEHILRYAIPWHSWPEDVTWPYGQPPQITHD